MHRCIFSSKVALSRLSGVFFNVSFPFFFYFAESYCPVSCRNKAVRPSKYSSERPFRVLIFVCAYIDAVVSSKVALKQNYLETSFKLSGFLLTFCFNFSFILQNLTVR